ncbi:MAG: NAD(P)H-dependent oxidoreductase [Xanthomonadales bacterium]|nr:NAD(P)H-dependent oxidoreductase [Xanthomonadales bacterium]
MNKVLVLFAHPVYQTSLVNKTLLAALPDSEFVTFHDLYEAYPDFLIDVHYEQQLLNDHDVIVFQHPLYWFSSPAILKEWMDLVLEHGYAYGTEGRALEGKQFISAISTGSDVVNYKGDRNIRNLLKPFEFTAKLCNMQYLPPFITYSGLKIKAGNFDQRLTQDYLSEQAGRYAYLLNELIQGNISEQECDAFNTMNQRYDTLEIHND